MLISKNSQNGDSIFGVQIFLLQLVTAYGHPQKFIHGSFLAENNFNEASTKYCICCTSDPIKLQTINYQTFNYFVDVKKVSGYLHLKLWPEKNGLRLFTEIRMESMQNRRCLHEKRRFRRIRSDIKLIICRKAIGFFERLLCIQ